LRRLRAAGAGAQSPLPDLAWEETVSAGGPAGEEGIAAEQPAETAIPAAAVPPTSTGGASAAPPQPPCGNCGRADCPTCGPLATSAAPTSAGGFVYALGRIEARFPNESVERELAQAIGRAETASLSDREAMQRVLSEPDNLYIARQLCWVLTIKNQLSYVLAPRDFVEVGMLVASLRPTPRSTDVDVVVGTAGGLAPPSMCNGLQLPLVIFAQIYSFDVDSFVDTISKPDGGDEKTHAATTEEMLDRVMQQNLNTGSSDEDRALNFLVLRYPAVFQKVAEMAARNYSWTVDTRPSRLSGARALVDVIFSFRDRQTDVIEKHFACVDVTEVFPFLTSKLSPYMYDR
jgi:hypothetical protein